MDYARTDRNQEIIAESLYLLWNDHARKTEKDGLNMSLWKGSPGRNRLLGLTKSCSQRESSKYLGTNCIWGEWVLSAIETIILFGYLDS